MATLFVPEHAGAEATIPLDTITLDTITVKADRGDTGDASKGPITRDAALGSKAPPGTAPALAPSQAKLSTAEPVAIVSDKALKDITAPSADYNEALKWTPGFTASNPNGVGDTVGAWRGFNNGQYNVTFDGIPFGDLTDQHSSNYFPAAFLGSIVVDRAPGPASQPGYATFGGTLALFSQDLTDRRGGSVSTYYGNHRTLATDISLQSGLLPTGAKFMLAYHHQNSDGTQDNGRQAGDFGLFKLEQPLGNFQATILSTIGQTFQNNVGFATFDQYQTFGKSFGGLGGDPSSQTYFGYNSFARRSDTEYVAVRGDILGWHVDNNAYTYGIGYPYLGDSGANVGVAVELARRHPPPNGASARAFDDGDPGDTPIIGVNPADVLGYKKYDDTRAIGDIFSASHPIVAGVASGTLETGFWYQHVENRRSQQNYDYTSGKYYSELGNPLTVSYQELFTAYVNSIYPFVQYDWRPIDNLTITPGYKYEYFARSHLATVNALTLATVNYAQTTGANLPFFTIRYRLNPNTSVYAQASEGLLPPDESAFYVTNTQENDVKPEKTENYQTGFVYKSGRLTADGDLYLIDAQHFATTSTDGTGATFYRDNGDAQYKGIEGELTYVLVKNLALYVNGTYNSGRYTSGLDADNNSHAGDAIGGTPRYTAALGLIYDDSRVFGSVLCHVVGDSWGTQGSDQILNPDTGSAFTVNRIPAYESTDLVAGYRVPAAQIGGATTALEFKVGVDNLLDSRVVTDIRGVPDTNVAPTANLSYQFQGSRTFYAGVKADF